jgi:hypothetical protein
VFGRFVLISTNNATVIAGANCDKTYHGTNIGGWDITCAAKVTKTNEAAQASIWTHQGITYAENHLSRLPLIVVMRELRVWDLWQPRRQAKVFSEGVQTDFAQVGVLAYYVLMLLAVPGLLLLRRRARPLLLVLLAPAVVVVISTAIGYGVPRLRYSFEIPLTVLAAAGLVSIQERLAARRRAPDRRPVPASEHAAV